MRRTLVAFALLAFVSTAAIAVIAIHRGRTSGLRPANASAGEACGPAEATTAIVAAGGRISGRFDPAMSGPCQFACATQAEFDAKEVLGQPGAMAGKLTQCPVSGVVFAVDAKRPHVLIGGEAYVTCCDGCAKKLERNPGNYLNL